MFILYNQLDTAQKILVGNKVMLRVNAPKDIIRSTLRIINPAVKIIGKEVILTYEMLRRIEREAKK
ncbi:hypothetical protein [Aquimarina algiphila]|uniref:hypothetical protein n=1 Tax=Aquimarina algiphila TaxID=2047982 RepID=UPI00232C8D63|nr:hypothetical protein [Aquimarina algiphila]